MLQVGRQVAVYDVRVAAAQIRIVVVDLSGKRPVHVTPGCDVHGFGHEGARQPAGVVAASVAAGPVVSVETVVVAAATMLKLYDLLRTIDYLQFTLYAPTYYVVF